MIRSRISKKYIYARAGSFRLFWRIRRAFLSKNFKRLRGIFKLRTSMDSTREELSALRVILRGIRLSLAAALLFLAGICAFEYHIATIAGWDFIQGNVVGEYLLGSLDSGSYTQLLATIATVTGVFLGLYFTAITAVIANIYSTVPNDVRELFIKDRLGGVYVKIVSFSATLSVLLLAISVIGAQPLHLVPPFFALTSVVMIFAFVHLGKRAFFLSDPTFMSGELSGDIWGWARRSTCKGWRWRDINFQEHYRKQTSKAISTLSALAAMSREKPKLRGDSYQSLVQNLIDTIRHYYSLKQLIPADSRWFRKRLQHKQWYLAESTELEMASQTDTALQPKEIPDACWVEDELLGVIFKGLEKAIAIKNKETLYEQLALLPPLFDSMGRHWSIEGGERWCNKITDAVLKQMIAQDSQTEESQPKYVAAIVEACALLPLSLELGFMKAVRELGVEDLRKKLIKSRWDKDSSPYQFAMPLDVVKELEGIRNGTVFEQASRLPYKAPNWYVIELASNNIDWALFRRWSRLIKLTGSWYAETGKKLADKNLHMHAAVVYVRAIEFACKLDGHLDSLKQTSEALREGALLDFRRPEWNWEKEQKSIIKFRNDSEENIAKLIPKLFLETVDTELPDHFGHAVHLTGKSCFDALMKGDAKRFKMLFKLYFVGILGVFGKLRPQVADWNPSSALAWVSEPIIDLFEISGYSFMLAEFHGNHEIWQASKTVWDKYLLHPQEGKQHLQFVAGLSYHHQKRFAISPRATLRAQNRLRFRDLLRELPKQEAGPSPFFGPQVQHPSPFIRSVASRAGLLPPDAIDVFTVKYLMSLPNATSVDFGVAQGKAVSMQGDQEQTDA